MMYSQNSLNIGKDCPHRIWWEEILQRQFSLSLSGHTHIVDTQTHANTHIQTHKKLLRMSMFPEGISTERDLYSSWHGRSSGLTYRHTHAHAYKHTRLPCIYPCGGWAVDKLSWQPPLHLVFPLHPVFFLSSSTSLPFIPCTTPITLFSTAAPCRLRESHVTGNRA